MRYSPQKFCPFNDTSTLQGFAGQDRVNEQTSCIPVGFTVKAVEGGGDNLLIAMKKFEASLNSEFNIQLNRTKLHTEIMSKPCKYAVDLSGDKRKEWNRLKAPDMALPGEFIQAYCNLYKRIVHIYFGPNKPLILKPIKLKDINTLPTLSLQLKGGNHYNILKPIGSQSKMVEEIFPLPIDQTKENKNIVQNFSDIKVPLKTDTVTEKVKDIPINLNSDTDDTKGFPIWKDSILCNHMTTNLSVTKIFFTEFRTDPYCCLWDTGSSINLISDSMAEQLMSEKIATASGSEEYLVRTIPPL
ncbi:unnamed protein product [Rotaria socialis]|uniref:Uncharacterized protein n=1 Tax=Rotaria socialis TaxID=392032 RepID=A0A821X4D4_9BILA|nr:unnamed protein product [Rotaria socialis]